LLNRLDTPALVLLYHRVTTLQSDPQQLAVSPENFYAQLEYLKNTHAVLPIEEFHDCLTRRKKLPRRTVVITFDDGYADNYLEALPILNTLSCQALFFITTSLLNTQRELWWDDLERILLTQKYLPHELELEVNGHHLHFNTSTLRGLHKAYDQLQPLLRFTPPVLRDAAMNYLRNWAGLREEGRASHRMLTHYELQQLSFSSAAVIGAHTHTHPSLATLPYEEQLQEIALSKNILEKICGQAPGYFSFPYGSKHDYNAASLRACRELGFKMVYANFYNQVHRWTNVLEVPRVLVRNWNIAEFKSKLKQFFHY